MNAKDKRQSLTMMAKRANGRSRMCGTCAYHESGNIEICFVCSKAFIEGYEKGYNQRKKEE